MTTAGAALLDVNVLVALFDPAHVHHEVAHDWFADHRTGGWATCAITENGFVRVVTHPAYAAGEPRPTAIVGLLRKFCASGHHHFWADGISIRDETVFDPSFIQGHRRLTDVYLLGLAKKMHGRLATFDRTIPLKSVVGAKAGLIQVIATA